MTTITHTPEGPRFDGMTVGELIAHLTNQSAHLMRVDLGAFTVDLDRAAAALRHLSARVAEVEGDATRFRWLASQDTPVVEAQLDTPGLWGDLVKVRAAIDAAMKDDAP